jgi:protein arginine kinase
MTWYENGENDRDVIVSSRVRFARNINGYAFGKKLTDEKAKEIIARVRDALGDSYKYTDFADVPPIEARSYAERHTVSPEFAAKKSPHALLSDIEKGVDIMVCEEDHIRIQCTLGGFDLKTAYETACAVDDMLDAKLSIAYDERLGYLTHCPTNLGTGMRASVMMFLPALTWARSIGGLQAQLSKLGITVRGIDGEGSDADGCLYQISNQITLGITEDETLRKLADVAASIMERERALRASWKGENLARLRDRVRRALGAMAYAEFMTTEEFMQLYTYVRLGASMGMVESLTPVELDSLLVAVRPATVTISGGSAEQLAKDASARDAARAKLVREKISV